MNTPLTLHSRLSLITQEIIDAICGIKAMPEGLLPHTVFVESEDNKGNPAYTTYQLVDIDPVEQNCIIHDKETNFQEEIALQVINTDGLITCWNRYLELSGDVETELTQDKQLAVFLYPCQRFERNATDCEIITDYETNQGQDPCVEKYTPDEFATIINDNGINYQEYFTRFINY